MTATENLEPLLYWCRERESIRLKKEAGRRAPWTTDPILSEFRFCNLRRRDDRASHWLIESVLTEANVRCDLASFLMFSAWCRWVNWPPTIEAAMRLGFYPRKQINWAGLGKFVDGIEGKAWTGAYMIRAPNDPGSMKGKHISERVVGTNFKAIVPKLVKVFSEASVTYRKVWTLLQTVDECGSFMAGQIVCDWTYTSLLCGAPDLYNFAPMGPGSIRGFNRLMGILPLNQAPPEELWLQKLGEWRLKVNDKLGLSRTDLIAHDVQNALCETDKYLRVKTGEGRPRAKYRTHEGEY